jgi:hypothetical protein
VAELSLNCDDIAGSLYQVPPHGVAGVMWSMALDAGQAAYLLPHRIDHPEVETTVAVALVAGDFHFLKSAILSLAT